MQLRIGINLGDVVIEGDDLFGDGVNVAARIEGLAEPGGVAISDSVHEHVRGRIAIDFVDRGQHEVKNIARPVHVWAWSPTMSRRKLLLKAADAPPPVPEKPSIAVLPFDNMSGDPEQGYFADGITEDIITDLSKVSGLFVIARNSSFAYKGKSPRPARGQPRARRALRAGRQRAARREPHPHQRADDRRADRRASLGRALRPRPVRHLRRAGRGDAHRSSTR